MHRVVGMRLRPLTYPSKLISGGAVRSYGLLGEVASAPVLLTVPRNKPPSISYGPKLGLTIARSISSTAFAQKGRRGGASALMPKRSRPMRSKVPGEGKKKKPKVHTPEQSVGTFVLKLMRLSLTHGTINLLMLVWLYVLAWYALCRRVCNMQHTHVLSYPPR